VVGIVSYVDLLGTIRALSEASARARRPAAAATHRRHARAAREG
jgi:hypothetical protein